MVLLIDAHAHVFASAAETARGIDALAPANRAAPIEEFRARLADRGIAGAVLVPLDTHDEYVARVLRELPPSFAAVAVASHTEQGRGGEDPVVALARRREGFPFRALRTSWLGEPGRSLRDSPMFPLLQHLQAQGIALWSYLPPAQTPHLDELGTVLPDLVVVLNHLGFAPHDMTVDADLRPRFHDALPEAEVARITALARHTSYRVMFSGHYALSAEPYPYADLAASGRRIVDAFGADRTMWGSDSPWIDRVPGYGATHDIVDTALPDLSPTERAAILGGTVARLFDLSA